MSTHTRRPTAVARTTPAPSTAVAFAACALATLAAAGALAGLLTTGGPGRHDVETLRGTTVTLYGEGLYRFDTWLVGAGNRGQDLVILLVEVPLLLVAVRWYLRRGPVAAAVLAGVLAFFAYFYVSMVFATAQNRMFPLYVAAAATAGFALVALATRIDVRRVAATLPDRPGRRALTTYLLGLGGALTLAWLPEVVATSVSGDLGESVGPYTSEVTVALDLGLVVPVVVIAAVQLLRRRPAGSVLTLVLLVMNVCIGVLLMGQGIAQLASGVPMTTGEIIGKMLTFAVLTLVAGGLLARMAFDARDRRA